MIETLLARRDLLSLPPRERRIARALRLWVAERSRGRCATKAVGAALGSLRAAAHLHLLLEEVGAAWPEPFAVSPPCCRGLSHDEALLADMMRLGAAGDRPGFDRLLREMLPEDERERLFHSASVLSRILTGA
jgi:hypothetical protein